MADARFPYHRVRGAVLLWLSSCIWLTVGFPVVLLVSAVGASLHSEARIFTNSRGQLYWSQFHGNMVQKCRSDEDSNCVFSGSAQCPADVSSRPWWGRVSHLLLTSMQLIYKAMPVLLHAHADHLGVGVQTDLQFEDEGAARPGKAKASTPQEASQTVRTLCSLTSAPKLVCSNRLQSAWNCPLSKRPHSAWANHSNVSYTQEAIQS